MSPYMLSLLAAVDAVDAEEVNAFFVLHIDEKAPSPPKLPFFFLGDCRNGSWLGPSFSNPLILLPGPTATFAEEPKPQVDNHEVEGGSSLAAVFASFSGGGAPTSHPDAAACPIYAAWFERPLTSVSKKPLGPACSSRSITNSEYTVSQPNIFPQVGPRTPRYLCPTEIPQKCFALMLFGME